MKFQGLIPVLRCEHIEQTLKFYQQALRYIIINKREGDSGLEWAHLKSDNTFIMLTRQISDKPDEITKKEKIMIYYYTDDVEGQKQFLQAKGYSSGPIKTTDFGMKEFFLQDPEGNKLAIGQTIKN